MPYYLLISAEITDTDKYAGYREAVTPLVTQFGGRYLVRGGEAEAFAGVYDGSRHVVLEFESKEAARTFWDSPEYAEVSKLREGASTGNVIGVEGV
jgi:uncharacterized protein (DUF1330 family)